MISDILKVGVRREPIVEIREKSPPPPLMTSSATFCADNSRFTSVSGKGFFVPELNLWTNSGVPAVENHRQKPFSGASEVRGIEYDDDDDNDDDNNDDDDDDYETNSSNGN